MTQNFFRKAFIAVCLSLMTLALSAQNLKVSGTVVDQNGDPMIGAGVFEKGTTNGVVTDLNGTFQIVVPEGSILVFSSVSFLTQEVPASAQMKVTMEEDREMLEEVVVIGYGTTRAKNFTGSVDVMKMSDSPVADLGLTNASDMIRGRLSGVIMGAESATVGSNSSIMVRGRKSINSTSTAPLLVVNGVIYTGNLEDIDPNSIESISALKDATSLAAYGSKAANGVLMITLK